MLFLALFFLALVQFLNFRLSPWEMAPVPISTVSLRGLWLPLPQATCLAAGGALSGEREGQEGEVEAVEQLRTQGLCCLISHTSG